MVNILNHNISQEWRERIAQAVVSQLENDFNTLIYPEFISISISSETEDLFLSALQSERINCATDIRLVYYSPFVFNGRLIIQPNNQNLESTEKFRIGLEFEPDEMRKLKKRIRQVDRWEKGIMLDGYKFPVRILARENDCRMNLFFRKELKIDEIKSIFQFLEEKRYLYDQIDDDDHIGMIHDFSIGEEIESASNQMTILLDLGCAAQAGLKFLIKSLDGSDFPVERIEVS